MDSTRLDQPTRSQLPDESYIEKLFPKCQPKSASNRNAAKQQFRNRRAMRPSDRQQHNRRQTRAKQQPQPPTQQQQQQLQLQPFRHESGPRGGKSDEAHLASNQNVRQQPGANNHNNNQQYPSSDSSDKEANPAKLPGSVAMRRSNSSQHYPLSNGQQPEPNPTLVNSSNGRRSKKYKASKNLQQQLRRSQSSYSKLLNSQPLPVDPSIKESLSPNEREPNRDHLGEGPKESAATNSRRNNSGRDSNSRGNSKDVATSGQKPERGNRTNRGIVFAEPIATLNIELEPTLPTPQPTAEADEQRATNSPAASSSGENEAKMTTSSTTTTTTMTLADGFQRHTAQQAAIGKVVADGTVQVGSDEKTGGEVNADIQQQPAELQYVNTGLLADDHRHEHQKPAACETGAKVDNCESDERFINLFVYDNTTTTTVPEKALERKYEQLDKNSLINICQQPEESTAARGATDLDAVGRKCELKSARQLLAIEPDEENLVSNDTSTEELCSFADNELELAADKIRNQNSRPASRRPPDYDDKLEKGPETGGAPQVAVAGKSILKHNHRSMGTLQTVDEKAEINIELEENNDPSARPHQIPKTTQIESSENNMAKKSFQPPGFPQRVRPAQMGEPNQRASPELPPTSPNSSNLLPVAGNSLAAGSQNLAPLQERDLPQVDGNKVDASQCIQLDNTSIKNLSEALTKVHLEPTVTQRQLKLPNETSHFYAVRPATQGTISDIVQRHQGMKFNTLSDAESNPDDDLVPSHQRYNSMSKTQAQKRQPAEFAPSSITRYANPGSSSRLEDDSMPATRTALVFPRLDEGLSSEAESCDDEVDDDDDKAMEADVEADDDDEDDDDDDDDDDDVDDNPSMALGLDSNAIQTDTFQHQSVKSQNRTHLTSIQMQSTSAGGQSRLPELNQLKFNDFNHQETLDQDDLKPVTSYANHNGQSNYWLGGTGQPSGAMSSQPAPFSRMQHGSNSSSSNNNNNNNNNSNSNNNLPRSNSYASREDVKTASRLSSDTDNETDRLLGSQRSDQLQKVANSELVGVNSVEPQAANCFSSKPGNNSREVLIEGVLFNVKYLGSTHTEFEGRGEKEDRIHQAELAVHEVKFRNGESHSPVEVQLFISTEKIMVLDDKHRKIMMDHSLRTISYIADIGDAIVLIVRKKSTNIDSGSSNNNNSNSNNDLARPTSKTSCHVFESSESHTITKSISQAFQVAYTELLKANGGGDGNNYLHKELDYQEVLNSQEMSTTELEMFARKENQREVIVPKRRGEILGLSIVESGWGSVLPTAVIASLKQDGPAYRCKKLSVGDQILSINGISLVGLSLAECQKILRKTKYQSVARLSVVPCPITVEVKIKRPDTKYQLGFSVQHGVICSLLRGGIAERGGVRVGHRIISINGTTVVGVPHDKIVTLLASSVGEIRMKTCLTSLYRHMLGEEKNVSFV